MSAYDVAVVGAGTAGAAAAALCAERGLRVLCLDAGPLDRAGARWVNGVPAWCFEAAGLAAPVGQELRGHRAPFHMIAGWGPERAVLRGADLMDVDMRRLVARLQRRARGAGAELRGGVRVRRREALDASVVIDASGIGGLGWASRPRPGREDLCAAAQQVRRVSDVAAAEGWLRAQGAAPGETVCFTGIAGGYSILNVQLHGDEVGLLTGSIPALGQPSGRLILERFAAAQPWVGAPLFGGARAIPLRPPYTRLDQGDLALLGDAGCQVFAIHGSGIGAGLIAARLLADALADGRGPWGYNVDWQRRFGGLFAASSLFARFSRGLSSQDLRRLLVAGLLPERLAILGLEQRPVQPRLSDLPALAWGAARAPSLLPRLLPVLARMGAVQALYSFYPEDPRRLGRWERSLRLIIRKV